MKEKTIPLAAHVPLTTLTESPKECANPDLLSLNIDTLSKDELYKLLGNLRNAYRICADKKLSTRIISRYNKVYKLLNLNKNAADSRDRVIKLDLPKDYIADIDKEQVAKNHYSNVISKRRRK